MNRLFAVSLHHSLGRGHLRREGLCPAHVYTRDTEVSKEISKEVSTMASWITLDAPTGHEHLAIEVIHGHFNGWERGAIISKHPDEFSEEAIEILKNSIKSRKNDGPN